MRFQWKFAVPVLVALAHDILITVGIYALLGREVTTATVAAVLTVLGYSIYDTIIIFDRIRENIPLMKRASFRVIANVSLWETIPRSLATTFITLLPITSLSLRRRHAEGLRLRAADRDRLGRLLVDLRRRPAARVFKEREPEYARRRDDERRRRVQSVGGALLATRGRRAPVAASRRGSCAGARRTRRPPPPASLGRARPQAPAAPQRPPPHGRAR